MVVVGSWGELLKHTVLTGWYWRSCGIGTWCLYLEVVVVVDSTIRTGNNAVRKAPSL